jgi:hypothetical protein
MNRDGVAMQAGLPPGPGGRVCCTLSPANGPFDRIVDLSQALDHHYGAKGFPINSLSEVSGVIYTCALGFLDLGHVRDLIDLTRFYYLHLSKHRRWRAGSKFNTFVSGGTVTILQDIPSRDWLHVARSMAYDESMYHELETYWSRFPGYHNSSFSPEDCVSNFLGTWIAEVAITAMETTPPPLAGDFDSEVTSALYSVLTRLGALPRDGTADAFAKITSPNGWVNGSSAFPSFLLRRNFAYRPINPWRVDGVIGCPSGSVPQEFAFELPATISSYYDVVFDVRYPWYVRNTLAVRSIPGATTTWVEVILDGQMIPGAPLRIAKADFEREVSRIKVEARARYGPGYDQPGGGM